MALPADDEKISQLYRALMDGDGKRVIELCRKIPEGPLQILTIHKDTVLHMAAYAEQKELVLKLLQELPRSRRHISKLTIQNDLGNTILHEAATSDKLVPVAREMLRLAPQLLSMRNQGAETAILRAARYGRMDMFRFLDCEVNRTFQGEEAEAEVEEERRNAFYRKGDQTTILHHSVLAEHFDLALYIAKEHESLVGAKDGDGMTALQLLACNTEAFKFGTGQRFLDWLINSCVSTGDTPAREEEFESRCRVPLWQTIRERKRRYESAVRLAQFLIARDTSWVATESVVSRSMPKPHKYGVVLSSTRERDDEQKVPTRKETRIVISAETPLILAAKSGILEIVEEIVKIYPQAIEHIDDDGRNILHVAIKYRQLHIFDFVEKFEIPMKRLVRKIMNDGNSILHMVGIKVNEKAYDDLRSPAFLLHEDLLLFERVRKITPAHIVNHYNNRKETATKLFAVSNAKLQSDAKDWLKRTSENCSIVAVLISTVAFAAAYTVPGGPNQSTGYPLLINKPFFVIFTMADVLSLAFALTSVIIFLSILTSPFRLIDFKQSLFQRLMLGVTLLIFSVSMMMVAFAATVVLLIRNKEQWTRVALYAVAFLPVSIFALSYMPLYVELMKSFTSSLKAIGKAFPRFNCGFLRSGKARPPILSNSAQPEEASRLHSV